MKKRILAQNEYRNNNTWETGLNNNDLIIGPSGAGKTQSYVKPNIKYANESLIVADTKGNLYNQFKDELIEKGYEVLLIDYNNLKNSYGYNPFDFVRYDKKTDTYNQKDMLKIAEVIVPQTDSREPFWENSAKLYLTSMIAYVFECLPKKEHNLETIYKLFSAVANGSYDNLMVMRELENPNSFAVREFKLFLTNEKSERMHNCIIGILSEKLNSLLLDDLLKLYKTPKRISFSNLSTQKTALFLTISDTDRSMDRLSSLFYTQSIQALCDIADKNEDSRLEIPVRFIFDDFATNTKIPNFDNIISVIRSREIYVSIILQSITQLNAIYGEERAKTIINNCDNCLYLGGQDIATAEYMSLKSNKPLNQILEMPLDSVYLFTRGEKAKQVKKYVITEEKTNEKIEISKGGKEYECSK